MSFEAGFILFGVAFLAVGFVGGWFGARSQSRMHREAEENREAMRRFNSSFLRSWFGNA